MKSFTELEAWKTGSLLLSEIYSLTKTFPKEERYGFTAQMRRSSSGILANIAEAFSRTSPDDKANRYTIARGECSEVHAFLLMSVQLGYLNHSAITNGVAWAERTERLLSGLIHAHRITPSPKRPNSLPPHA